MQSPLFIQHCFLLTFLQLHWGRPGISTPDKVEGPQGAVGTATCSCPAVPKCAHQYVQNAWEWDKHDLKVSRDPAGCLALHSRPERDKDPLLRGNLWERRTEKEWLQFSN